MKRALSPVSRAIAWLILLPIRAYSRWISPVMPRRCKYEPTCSAYAQQAIRELGPTRGTILAVWRLVRCNPFSHGGIDDVADRKFFRGPDHSHPHEHGQVSAG